MKNAFTADNILSTYVVLEEGLRTTIRYEIGHTDSDVGAVDVNLYDTGLDEDKTYDVFIEVNGDINWGLAACASALLVVAQDFPVRFPQYKITDNTSIEL